MSNPGGRGSGGGPTATAEPVPAAIQAYLDELARRLLDVRGVDRERVVDEARDHLLDAVAERMRAGMPPEESVAFAIGGFGAAKELAEQFQRLAPRRPRWRALGEGLIGLTFRRRIVAEQRERQCSFCGKGQSKVTRMIAGPNDVQICSECVALCNQIIRKAEGDAAPAPA